MTNLLNELFDAAEAPLEKRVEALEMKVAQISGFILQYQINKIKDMHEKGIITPFSAIPEDKL